MGEYPDSRVWTTAGCTIKQTTNSRALTSHRLLTSDEIIEEKRRKEVLKNIKIEKTGKGKGKDKGKSKAPTPTACKIDTNRCSLCEIPYEGGDDEPNWVECSRCLKWMHVDCIPLSSDISRIYVAGGVFLCPEH